MSLTIFNISANGLLAADAGAFHRGKPSSDPYAVFLLDNQKEKTKVVSKNLDPVWDDTITLQVPANGTSQLLVRVFDHDKLGHHDPLGEYVLDLPKTNTSTTVSGALRNQPKQKKHATGKINFSYSIAYGGTAPAPHRASIASSADAEGGMLSESVSSATGKLIITALSAQGLRAADKKLFGQDSSDPYCKISVSSASGVEETQTEIIHKTLNPDWGKNFKKALEVDVWDPQSTVTFTVWDHDNVSKDDYLGEYSFSPGVQSKGKGSFTAELKNVQGTSKAVRGHLQCEYIYRAPEEDGLGKLTKKDIRNGSFGKFVIRNLSCRGLRAADSGLGPFRKASSDPYVKVSVREATTAQVKETGVKKSELNPKWAEYLVFDVYQRYFEVCLEVLDKDQVGEDDSLGMFRFEIPDRDTDYTWMTDKELQPNPVRRNKNVSTCGVISFEYTIQYDEDMEWNACFGPFPKHLTHRDSAAAAKADFNLLRTFAFVNRLIEISNHFWELYAFITDILMWKNPFLTAPVFVVLLWICYKSLFFQAMNAGLCGIFYWTWVKRGTPPTPPPPPVTAEEAEQQQGPMAFITQQTYFYCQTCDMLQDMFTWRDPMFTKLLFLVSIVCFVISWLVPVWAIMLVLVIYAFTINSFHLNYPLFSMRFPIWRLIPMFIDWMLTKVTGQHYVPEPWHAKVHVKVLEVQGLYKSASANVPLVGQRMLPDPFCFVGISGDMRFTNQVDDNCNPKFNEVVTAGKSGNTERKPFMIERAGQRLIVEVYDYDKGSKCDFLGEAIWRISEYMPRTDVWLLLNRKPGGNINEFPQGRVHLQVTVEELSKEDREALKRPK